VLVGVHLLVIGVLLGVVHVHLLKLVVLKGSEVAEVLLHSVDAVAVVIISSPVLAPEARVCPLLIVVPLLRVHPLSPILGLEPEGPVVGNCAAGMVAEVVLEAALVGTLAPVHFELELLVLKCAFGWSLLALGPQAASDLLAGGADDVALALLLLYGLRLGLGKGANVGNGATLLDRGLEALDLVVLVEEAHHAILNQVGVVVQLQQLLVHLYHDVVLPL